MRRRPRACTPTPAPRGLNTGRRSWRASPAPRSPRDAVAFARTTLQDVRLAWDLAHALGLRDDQTWGDLATAYATVDRVAVLPVLAGLVERGLTEANARNYRVAARRLATMRRLAAGTGQGAAVDDLIAAPRDTHRRRPRLLHEFDRAGLP